MSNPVSLPKLLSVDDAREIYAASCDRQKTRAGFEGLLSVGAVTLDWSAAEASFNERITCIDVPMETEYAYTFAHVSNQKEEKYVAQGWSKMTIVKSLETGSTEAYVHYFIPDEYYASIYDCDISTLFNNCDDRDDSADWRFIRH